MVSSVEKGATLLLNYCGISSVMLTTYKHPLSSQELSHICFRSKPRKEHNVIVLATLVHLFQYVVSLVIVKVVVWCSIIFGSKF